MTEPLLIIACGVLAHELVALIRANAWEHVTVQCLPADLHNAPQKIPDAVRAKLERAGADYRRVFIAYGDCGTGGRLDRLLEEYQQQGLAIERIPGAHCYEFFAGQPVFAALADAEPGTLYLTDFLARHFERLIWQGLGLDRHPELMSDYFGNYRKLIYLVQHEQPRYMSQARLAAERLGLAFEYRQTGYGDLQTSLVHFAEKANVDMKVA